MALRHKGEYTAIERLIKDKKAWQEMQDSLATSLALTFLPIWLAGYSAGAHVRPRRQKAISATPPSLPEVAPTPKLLPQDELAQIANDAMTTYAQQMATYLTDSTREQVTQALLTAQAQGTGSPGVLAQIETLFSPERAQRIAITETTKVFGAGAMAQYAAQGVSGWEWSTCNDAWVCPECAGMEGQDFSVSDDAFSPLHTNCRCFPRPMSSEGDVQPEEELSPTADVQAGAPLDDATIQAMTIERRTAFLDSLSEEDRKAIEEYPGPRGTNSLINKALRFTPPEDRELTDIEQFTVDDGLNAAAKIDKAMTGVMGDNPMVLYRGVNSDRVLGDVRAGDIFQDKGFISTSTDPKWADSFRTATTWSGGGPSNGKLIAIEDISPKQRLAWIPRSREVDRDEYEVLLPHGTRFEVKSIDANGVIHVRIVPEPIAQAAAASSSGTLTEAEARDFLQGSVN